MRSVVFRYDDLPRLLEALDAATGQALPVPSGVIVRDGEWVLALFELSESSRATAAAGRGAMLDEGVALVFERRDWERLRQFASARAEAQVPLVSGERPSLTTLQGTAGVAETPSRPEPRSDVARLTPPGGLRAVPPAATPSLRSTQAWESNVDPLPTPVPSEAPDTRTDEIPPVVAPSSAPPPPPPSAEEPTVRKPRRLRGEGARVILVDDDPDLREIVGAMLEAVGLTVTAIGSAEEALDLAREDAPDLLVLDWNLPGMSGLELCKVVRAHGPLAALPILFLTAHSATQDMVEAFAAGANDYVVKPFRAAELGARIFGLLRRTHGAGARL